MHHTIPARLNLGIAGSIVLLNAAALFLLPLAIAQNWRFALLLLPIGLLASMQWGLIHEAIHHILHPDRTTNDRLGRTLSILLGTSFSILRFGHLMHHKLNRNWQSERHCSRAAYYWNLLAGVYVSEVVSALLMTFLPRKPFLAFARATLLRDYPEVSATGERFFYEQEQVSEVRIDMGLVLLIYATAAIAYGTFWPLLAAFVALRALVISFLDNIYHYGTPADNSKAGKELKLPAVASYLLLNSNYHESHHLNPRVPWLALPEVHATQTRGFDGDFLPHGLMQFSGPL